MTSFIPFVVSLSNHARRTADAIARLDVEPDAMPFPEHHARRPDFDFAFDRAGDLGVCRHGRGNERHADAVLRTCGKHGRRSGRHARMADLNAVERIEQDGPSELLKQHKVTIVARGLVTGETGRLRRARLHPASRPGSRRVAGYRSGQPGSAVQRASHATTCGYGSSGIFPSGAVCA